MQGIIISNKLQSPRNTNINSYTIQITVATGTTRIINFHNELRGLCRSFSVINRDGANANTVIINNDRINSVSVASNSTFNANDQWTEQLEVTAGAAGATNLFLEIVPDSQLDWWSNWDLEEEDQALRVRQY